MNRNKKIMLSLVMSTLVSVTGMTNAKQMGVNYDRISFLEAPLARDFGGVTVLFEGVVDARYSYDDVLQEGDGNVVSELELSAQKQLNNAITVGANYALDYDDRDAQDEFIVYGSNVWGRLSAGNVGELTRDKTARQDLVANAELAFDDFYGQLDDYGVAYEGRYSAHTINSVIDKDGDFDLGISYERPIDDKDYRLSARYQQAALDADAQVESNALELVAELIYGSSLMDLSLGTEKIDVRGTDLERWFVGAGVTHKFNALSVSLAAQYGETDKSQEHSAALGVRYDIARGLSAGMAVNYVDNSVNIEELGVFEEPRTEYIVALSYEF